MRPSFSPAHAEAHLHARHLLDDLLEGGLPPRGSQVELAALEDDLRAPERRQRRSADQVLLQLGHVVIVGVGLICLEHRELGVVLRTDALVAEHTPDLEDALEPADHASLQVQLEGDPQVEVRVHRVVVGHERLGEASTWDRVQDRGLHLDVPALCQQAPDGRDDAGTQQETIAHSLVRP